MTLLSEMLTDTPSEVYKLADGSGTTAADSSGNSVNGTYANAPTLTNASIVAGETAATFLGTSSQRVDLTTLGTLGSNAITSSWEFWIKKNGNTGAIECAFGCSNSNNMLVEVLLNSTTGGAFSAGKTTFFIRGTANNITSGQISTNIYDNAYHHVVVVMESATTMSIYVDGVSQTVTYGNQAMTTVGNFSTIMCIGARNTIGTPGLYMTGTLAYVAFYPTRLTAARVLAHYNAAVVSTVTKTLTSSYNIIKQISKTNTASYNIKVQVAKTASTSYTVRQQISKTRTASYNVIQRITKTITPSYNIGAVPANTVAPSITGIPLSGQLLTADHGTWSNSPTSYQYQWQVEDSPGSGTYSDIAGETGATLQL